MRLVPTSLPEVVLIEPEVHFDGRGFFVESFQEKRYHDCGIGGPFVQDNHSCSVYGTLRGLHIQMRRPQGKLVRVVVGEIFDVAVDVRPESPRYGRWVGVPLSGDSLRQLYVPPGFAHGFCALSSCAHVEYKCTQYYDPGGELTVLWNDPELAIEWPVRNPLLSSKDANGLPLSALSSERRLYGT